jgi:hypothetical protein
MEMMKKRRRKNNRPGATVIAAARSFKLRLREIWSFFITGCFVF